MHISTAISQEIGSKEKLMFIEKMGGGGRMRHSSPSSQAAARPLKHFCKTISPDNLEDKKLRMPNAFVNEFKDELSDIAKVMDPSGHTWEIGLTKSDEHIWFDNGWHEFIDHYSITSGYILVFGYRGASDFDVLICDMSDFEIQYPDNDLEGTEAPNNHEKHSKDTGSGEADDDDNANTLGSSYHGLRKIISKGKTRNVKVRKRGAAEKQKQETNEHCLPVGSSIRKDCREENRMLEKHVEGGTYEARNLKCEKFDEEGISLTQTPLVANEMKDGENDFLPKCEGFAVDMFTCGFRNASEKSESAIYNARKLKTKNPSFMAVLRPHHLRFLYFPVQFAKKYVNNAPAYIKLQVSDGRQWVARLGRGQRSLSIGSGWRFFLKENCLDEGDVLVFEWIKKDITMKISIFRAVQDGQMGNSGSIANDDALQV